MDITIQTSATYATESEKLLTAITGNMRNVYTKPENLRAIINHRGVSMTENQVDSRGFIHCPCCNRKTKTKVNKDTILINFPLYCSWCKTETIIDVELNKVKEEPKSR